MSDLSFWVTMLLNGLSIGSAYALFAVGLAIIFGVARVVNFAHGDFYMIGGYLAVFAAGGLGLGFWGAMVVSTLGLAVLGLVAYYLLFRRFINNSRAEMAIVSTLGLGLMLQYGVLEFAGGDARRLQTTMTSETVSLGLADISIARLAVIGLSALAIGVLAVWLKWSRPGRAIRAISQSREAAEVVGISADRMSALAITVGLGLAGVAAAALTPLYGVFPFVGQVLVMKAFAIVVLAGFGSLPGTAVAAVGVGIAESIAGGLGSAALQNSAAFIILIVALVLRPQGLFGKGARVA